MSEYTLDDYYDGESYKVELNSGGLIHKILMADRNTDGDCCESRSPDDEWACTLDVGHTGYHVGHTSHQVVGVWEGEEEDEEEPEVIKSEPYDPMGWLDVGKEDE